MAAPKKFGAFAGVFTPSILTILGVIMYMRFGWIVGNAGLWGTLIVVFIAHIISFTTGLSISSIATDKKIGAGGVYYVLSRSLGLPIGGAIGLTLFVGTAFSIALYLIGFSESFNEYLGFDTSLDGYRITAGITLLVLTIIAFISTSIALKTQFFILLAIILSLISIFFGHSEFVPETVNSFGGADSVPMETVFAIFFPAVTGFTAGIAMSGDLKDPKKSIPIGTMMAIVVGLIVYTGLAVFIALMIRPDVLATDNGILLKIALYSPFVVAGIWGATLSSAIGGILGGPRILQAMSLDKITPMIFGKGQGKNNEPRLALILTVIIAFGGILIGELNMIARLVSMFYLAAYGFINLSFFLESWASSDFKPSFKVNKWIGFVGFITTFIIMFRLDMLAMFLSFVVIGGVYLWLSKKQISLGEGDIWQSVWTNIVKKGLHSLDHKEDHKRNWKPNILLFSGKKKTRVYLLEFSRFLAGKMGIVTNFDLIENKNAGELFSKHKQSYNDEVLEEYGIFGRQLEVKNIYDGISTIASVFGFSGIEPNTVLMGWARNSKDPENFSLMTNKLIGLDYNVLYLDYDKEMGFGKYETIDLWWRGISSNAELSLMIVKLLAASSEWGMAKIRIILVNNTGNDQQIIKRKIEILIDSFRVKADVFIINNYTDNKSIYELMKIYSGTTDLIILGVPDIIKNEEGKFVKQVNDLVDVLGTTLLVKASSKFEVADLGLQNNVEMEEDDSVEIAYMPVLKKPADDKVLSLVQDLDKSLLKLANDFKNNVFSASSIEFGAIINEYKKEITESFEYLKDNKVNVINKLIELNKQLVIISQRYVDSNLNPIKDIIESGIGDYLEAREELLKYQPLTVTVQNDRIIKWRDIILKNSDISFPKEFYLVLKMFLNKQAELIANIPNKVQSISVRFLQNLSANSLEKSIELFETEINDLFKELNIYLKESKNKPAKQLRYISRTIVNNISKTIEEKQIIPKLNRKSRKTNKEYFENINSFNEFWAEIQSLLWNKAIIDFEQNSLYLNIVNEMDLVADNIERDVFVKLSGVIKNLEKLITKIENVNKSINEFTISSKDFSIDSIQVDSAQALSIVHHNLNELLVNIPENIQLLSKYAYNELLKNQLNDVDAIDLPLKRIDNHLLSTKLLSPLERKFEDLNVEIEDVKSKINNLLSLLKYTSGTAKKDNDVELKALLQNIKGEFAKTKEKYGYSIVQFKEHYSQIVQQFGMTLYSDNILEHISELNLNIKKDKKQKGIKLVYKQINNKIAAKKQKVLDFVSRKNEDVRRLEYERKLDVFIPEHLKLRELVNGLVTKRGIVELLPYYYYQIFTGKHYLLHSYAENRSRELIKAKDAIEDIKAGMKSSILVTGVSGIGKSFFVENLAENVLDAKVVKLNIDSLNNEKPIESALKSVAEKNGNIDFMINDFERGTVFIIEDIERFIGIKEKTEPLLNALSELIDRNGSKYYFLLTANANSLKILDSVSRIMGSIVTTIPLGPLSEKYIHDIIIDRHSSGNIQLLDKKGVVLSSKILNKIIENINDLAYGNIGIALQLWLASMSKDEDDIVMDFIDVPEVEIGNSIWLSLLNRMIVFGHLDKNELESLYGEERLEDIKKNLNLLMKTKLVICNRNRDYEIPKHIKPFVEIWLKSKEVI